MLLIFLYIFNIFKLGSHTRFFPLPFVFTFFLFFLGESQAGTKQVMVNVLSKGETRHPANSPVTFA